MDYSTRTTMLIEHENGSDRTQLPTRRWTDTFRGYDVIETG
jgi:hypothetical protein